RTRATRHFTPLSRRISTHMHMLAPAFTVRQIKRSSVVCSMFIVCSSLVRLFRRVSFGCSHVLQLARTHSNILHPLFTFRLCLCAQTRVASCCTHLRMHAVRNTNNATLWVCKVQKLIGRSRAFIWLVCSCCTFEAVCENVCQINGFVESP